MWGNFWQSPQKPPSFVNHHLCCKMIDGKCFINKHSENIGIKTFVIECSNNWYENQLLLNVCKIFLEQTFVKHCQQMLFKCFMYSVQ